MYALSHQNRRQEDSDEDDHPQAPARNISDSATDESPLAVKSGGGGVAAAIKAARARHPSVQKDKTKSKIPTKSIIRKGLVMTKLE